MQSQNQLTLTTSLTVHKRDALPHVTGILALNEMPRVSKFSVISQTLVANFPQVLLLTSLSSAQHYEHATTIPHVTNTTRH